MQDITYGVTFAYIDRIEPKLSIIVALIGKKDNFAGK